MLCISKSELKNLWLKKQEKRLDLHIKKFPSLSLQEMHDQMLNERGSFFDSFTQDTKNFAGRTENVEMMVSLDLSDFYFGDKSDTSICFEMRSSFSENYINDYDQLVSSIASATHIDCCIKFDRKEYKFQIKRYPGNYHEQSNEALLEFLKASFKKYGDMKRIILVLLLQPSLAIEMPFDFEKIHDELSARPNAVTFDEVFLLFNGQNQKLFLSRVFPDHVIFEKPIRFLSEKYQKLQKDLRSKA